LFLHGMLHHWTAWSKALESQAMGGAS
jgi:hypothetical protein